VAEAVMGGRNCELAAAALRAAPVIVGALVFAWKLPDLFMPVFAAALYVRSPWRKSAATQWLSARHASPQFSTNSGFIFEPVQGDLWVQWMSTWRRLKSTFGFLWFAGAVVWVGGLLIAVTRCWPGAITTLSTWFGSAGRGRPLVEAGLYSLAAALLAGLFSAAWAALTHWRTRRRWSKPFRGADARGSGREDLGGSLVEVLKQVPLFEALEAEDLSALAAALEPVRLGRGQRLFKEDEPGDAFYVLQEGELEVLKRLPGTKRTATIGWMGPGDCFGEIALLEGGPRTATIKARRPSRLLKLSRGEFERLVLARVGQDRLRELLQYARYLGRLTFTAGWPFAELVDFARRCRSVRFDAGDLALRRGDPNHWFYLIFDGAFEARVGERVLRRMGPGDYFGEISLLENWEVTADVVALEESRCLTLNRPDFLALFAKDFRIGLRMEAVAGQRLGADVFKSR
jgi:CRP-like cAMP-binding protein